MNDYETDDDPLRVYSPLLEAWTTISVLEVRLEHEKKDRPQDVLLDRETGQPLKMLAHETVEDLVCRISDVGLYTVQARRPNGTIQAKKYWRLRPARPQAATIGQAAHVDRSAVEELLKQHLEQTRTELARANQRNDQFLADLRKAEVAMTSAQTENAALITRATGAEDRLEDAVQKLREAEATLASMKDKLRESETSPLDVLGQLDTAMESVQGMIKRFTDSD